MERLRRSTARRRHQEALVADHSTAKGAQTVAVDRNDGLSVIVTTSDGWGNNTASGMPPVTDLPGIDKLVELAASPQLTFPRALSRGPATGGWRATRVVASSARS